MLLGDAVMLFHRKMRHYKKYRALTDTDPLVLDNRELLISYKIFGSLLSCSWFHVSISIGLCVPKSPLQLWPNMCVFQILEKLPDFDRLQLALKPLCQFQITRYQ